MPVRDYPYYVVSLYLRTGSGEFPLWRRCGRFMESPIFGTIAFTGVTTEYVYLCICIYFIETVEEDCQILYLPRAEIKAIAQG